MLLQGLTISPVFALEEQYQYERTKVNFSVQEEQQPLNNLSRTISGRYETCKSELYDMVEKKYGVDVYKTYTVDPNNGNVNLITPYSIRNVNLLESPVMYRYNRYGTLEKITIDVLEKSNGGALYYMRSLAPSDEIRLEDKGIIDDPVTSPAAIQLEPSTKSKISAQFIRITDPVDPPKNDECQLICKIYELKVITSMAPNKEIITAGATAYPIDGIAGGYYYKRLGVIRTVAPPEIKGVQVVADTHGLTVIPTTGNITADLDPSPYQFTINNKTSEWLAQPNYQANELIANTNYAITVRLKGIKGQIVEKALNKMTLAEKPNLEVVKLTTTDVSLKVTDQNPQNTKYQIKIGAKYVLENGQMSTAEQWITIPTKQIKVIEKLTATNSKISIKARNEENIATSETVITTIAPPSAALIKSAKAIEGTYAIKLKLSPSVPAKTLDKAPYQFVINGVASEWGKLPYYTFMNLQPNTEYKLIGRIKDSKGAISEVELTKRTLPQEQRLTFKYDDASMLLEIEQPNLSDLFNYDNFGNMIRKLFTTK